MNESLLKNLIDLAEFDQKVVAVRREIEKLEFALQDDQKEMELCRVGLEKIRTHKQEARKEVDARELEMKMLDAKEKEEQKRLDSASNQREYNAIQKEIEQLKKQQHDLEEALLAAWKNYEHAEQETKEREGFCDEKMTSLNTVIKEKMQKIHELNEQLTMHLDARAEMVKNVPEEFVERYDVMYQKIPNPIVPVEKNSCSACFYPIIQQDLLDLRRGKILQCKDCFRFLYYDKEKAEK